MLKPDEMPSEQQKDCTHSASSSDRGVSFARGSGAVVRLCLLLLSFSIAGFTPSAVAADDVVVLRRELTDAEDTPARKIRGEILRLDDGGLVIDSAVQGSQVVTWDRVRDVQTEDEDHETAWVNRRRFAEQMWRARSRVERGDHAGAVGILDALFKDAQGRTDGSALVIAEGLVRSRMALGQRPLAVLPWLETLRMREAGVNIEAYSDLNTIIDEEKGLIWDLPPVFEPGDGDVDRMIDDLLVYVPIGAAEIEEFARLYLLAGGQAVSRSAVRDEIVSGIDSSAMQDLILRGVTESPWFVRGSNADVTLTSLERSPGSQISSRGEEALERRRGPTGVAEIDDDQLTDLREGVRLAAAIVASGLDRYPGLRNAAITTLTRPIDADRQDASLAAWSYFGRGRARVQSIDADLRQLGLLDLLMLPARYATTAPRLTRLALLSAAPEIENVVSQAAVDSIFAEFNLRYPRYAISRAEMLRHAAMRDPMEPDDAPAATSEDSGQSDSGGSSGSSGSSSKSSDGSVDRNNDRNDGSASVVPVRPASHPEWMSPSQPFSEHGVLV